MKDTRSENPQHNSDTVKGRKTGSAKSAGVKDGLNEASAIGREVDMGQMTTGNDHKPMRQSGRAGNDGHPGRFEWK